MTFPASCAKSAPRAVTSPAASAAVLTMFGRSFMIPSFSSMASVLLPAWPTKPSATAGWMIPQHSPSKGLETESSNPRCESLSEHSEQASYPVMALASPVSFRSEDRRDGDDDAFLSRSGLPRPGDRLVAQCRPERTSPGHDTPWFGKSLVFVSGRRQGPDRRWGGPYE